MKVEDALASDDFHQVTRRGKSSGFCSKLWFFLKFAMFGALLSVVLTLLLVFLTGNKNLVNCLPKFNLIVQHKYIDGCLNDGIYGSVRACNEYYRCQNGVPKPELCPFGKEWSSVNNTCVSRSQSDCSRMFYCPKLFGRFRNELHCDTFYACFFNQPYLIYCPPPLLFSTATRNCEWPEDSDCPPPKPTTTTRRPTTERQTTTESPPSSTEAVTVTTAKAYDCPSPNGFFADPEDCTAYYFCDENVGTKMHCAEGKGFNSQHLSCNEPNDSDCAKKEK